MDFDEFRLRANTLHKYTRTKLSMRLKSSSKWQRHLKEQKEQFDKENIETENIIKLESDMKYGK